MINHFVTYENETTFLFCEICYDQIYDFQFVSFAQNNIVEEISILFLLGYNSFSVFQISPICQVIFMEFYFIHEDNQYISCKLKIWISRYVFKKSDLSSCHDGKICKLLVWCTFSHIWHTKVMQFVGSKISRTNETHGASSANMN